MTSPHAAILALAMVGACALSAPAQAAEVDARLDAFRAACMPQHRQPALRPAVIRGEGWTPAPDGADPMLAEVMRMARSVAEEGKADGITSDLSVWSKAVDGRPAFLVQSTIRSEAIVLNSCHFYDFGSLTPVDPAQVEAWLHEAPAQTVDRAGIVAQIWNAEEIDGVLDLQASLVSPDSQAAKVLGFHGVSIMVTSGVESAP